MEINKKLGYYTCNGQVFRSKIKACIYSTSIKQPVEWHFNDAEFSSYDWTVEPELSLDQLYNRRARELREKYDYIALSYSGGSDSNNVLEAFLRQNLLIDEIIVNTLQEGNTLYSNNTSIKECWNESAEHDLHRVHRLDYIKRVSPKTKITVVDVTPTIFKMLTDAKDGSWISDRQEVLNVSGATRYNYLLFADLERKFDVGKTIGLIFGVEKPRTLIYKNNNFYITFSDKASNIVSADTYFTDYNNTTIEYFYWDPSCLDMICKQAHIIKRWVEMNPQMKTIWYSDGDRAKQLYNHRVYHEEIYKTLIYSTWNSNWFQVKKSTKDWNSELDEWFKQYSATSAYAIWQEGINYVAENASDYVYQKDGSNEGLRAFYKNYLIGEMKQ